MPKYTPDAEDLKKQQELKQKNSPYPQIDTSEFYSPLVNTLKDVAGIPKPAPKPEPAKQSDFETSAYGQGDVVNPHSRDVVTSTEDKGLPAAKKEVISPELPSYTDEDEQKLKEASPGIYLRWIREGRVTDPREILAGMQADKQRAASAVQESQRQPISKVLEQYPSIEAEDKFSRIKGTLRK